MNLANTLSILLMVIGAIIGIVVWIILMQADNGVVGFFVGAIIFGLNALFSWILYLLLYAFGELVYKTSQIEDMLRTSITSNNVNNNRASQGVSPAVGQSNVQAIRSITPQTVSPKRTETITCPFCKKVYPSGTIYCKDCNAQIGSKK